ncbi:MAG: nucleotidyltransferase domain-containing protein [Candidatus Desulfacyla sp.]
MVFQPCWLVHLLGEWVQNGLDGATSMRSFQETSLKMNERRAIEAAEKIIIKQFPIQRVILFGSKARGDSDEHSDMDLLLISSRKLHWKEEKAVTEILFDIGMEYDVIFSPLFVSGEEWDGGIFTRFPVYEEIVRDGAIVA